MVCPISVVAQGGLELDSHGGLASTAFQVWLMLAQSQLLHALLLDSFGDTNMKSAAFPISAAACGSFINSNPTAKHKIVDDAIAAAGGCTAGDGGHGGADPALYDRRIPFAEAALSAIVLLIGVG